VEAARRAPGTKNGGTALIERGEETRVILLLILAHGTLLVDDLRTEP
jgi:hypothetical protein